MRRFVVQLALLVAMFAMPSFVLAGDQEIANELVKQLQVNKKSGQLANFGIDLEIDRGVVWLKGHVTSRDHHKLVLNIARSITGVEELIDDIEVRKNGAPSNPAPQTAQTTRTPATSNSMFSSNPIKSSQAFFTTLKEKVAPSAAPQSQSTATTTQSNNSRSLLSIFADKVMPGSQPQATQTQRPQVETRAKPVLTTSQRTNAVNPIPQNRAEQVSTQQIATRRPTVKPSLAQTHHLQQQTLTQAEARPIVQAPQRANDEVIAQAVIGKLREQQQTGSLRDFTLDVTVDAGSVWIKGSVASPQQHQLVLEVSRRVAGVTQVVNDITVNRIAGVTNKPRVHPISDARPPQQTTVATQPSVPSPVGNNPQAAPARTANAGQIAQGPAPVVRTAQPFPQASAQPGATNRTVLQNQFHTHNHANHQPVAFAPAGGAQPVGLNSASGVARARFDHPNMPAYAWPSYASYPNYGAVTYPKQYSPAAWPYIGPFYPYPQVPLGWRKVSLQWDDGWWFLDFKSK